MAATDRCMAERQSNTPGTAGSAGARARRARRDSRDGLPAAEPVPAGARATPEDPGEERVGAEPEARGKQPRFRLQVGTREDGERAPQDRSNEQAHEQPGDRRG